MAHSYQQGLVTLRYQVRIPVGSDSCTRGCACTVLKPVQRHRVCSAGSDAVHYKEPIRNKRWA